VPVQQIVVTGGAARSRFWCQMFADCTGRRVVLTDTVEAGARGVAMAAGVGVGIYDDLVAAASEATRAVECFEPDATASAAYVEIHGLYRQVSQAMRQSWRQRAVTLEHVRALQRQGASGKSDP
jgi:sugar (pentulose or hexulose) kinase